MDFDDTPEEAAFRAEARAWLAEHAELRTGRARSPLAAATDPGHVQACKEWQRTLYDGGWAGITWPKEHGGRGLSAIQSSIFNQEQARFDVHTGVFTVAIGMVGPTLIAQGTEEQKERYLDPILRGDEVWCQLFSEPGAGSDLAGLATRGVVDGDEVVVNGQKVWTSGAQHSQWGILLVRTDPDVPKHRGITYLLVDMASPGIEVRPLRQITGDAHFNEVFLTDVRVPLANVVGEVDGGWGPVLTTLMNERSAISGGGSSTPFGDLADLARSNGRAEVPRARQDLARAYTRYELIRYLGLRVQTALSQGTPVGPEASIMKLVYSKHLAATNDLAMALSGGSGTLVGADAARGGFWQSQFLGQWAARIGGGTDEVQRNIIGERVLGLPREPRTDKDVPFRDLPRNG